MTASPRRNAVVAGLVAAVLALAGVIAYLVTRTEPVPPLPAAQGTYTTLPNADEIPTRQEDDPKAHGDVDAPVVMVMWADYGCHFCKVFMDETYPELQQYVEDGILRIESREFPIFGDPSLQTATAAIAAGRQGKYFEYHDWLFANQSTIQNGGVSTEWLEEGATSLGLDLEQFRADVADPAIAEQLAAEAQQAVLTGATGTPAFLINGIPIAGAQPTAAFVDVIAFAYEHAEGN